MLLKCDETRSGRLETKRRKQFWKQCAIKQQSSPRKALLWVLKGSSGPKNNWVDSQNRSSPSHREKPLQCPAPTQPPLVRNFRTSTVLPALRCPHKSGFPVRDFWGCRQHLMPWNHSPEHALPGHPPGLHLPQFSPLFYGRGRQGWNVRGCLLLPVVTQCHHFPREAASRLADHRLPPSSHELCHLLHSQS